MYPKTDEASYDDRDICSYHYFLAALIPIHPQWLQLANLYPNLLTSSEVNRILELAGDMDYHDERFVSS